MKERMEAGEVLNNVKTCSSPSELRITDIRFADIWNAPMHCILVKVFTNQGLVGYGEVRDFADKRYALMLKSKLIGENPCNVDRIFRTRCWAANSGMRSAATVTRMWKGKTAGRRWVRP